MVNNQPAICHCDADEEHVSRLIMPFYRALDAHRRLDSSPASMVTPDWRESELNTGFMTFADHLNHPARPGRSRPNKIFLGPVCSIPSTVASA